ncbi:MAG: cytochrome c oxidase subunit II [Candidatus Acidiferrales bacterium]
MMRRISPFWFIAAAFLFAGCHASQTTLKGHGPAASRIASLSWLMTILFLVVTVITWAILAWGFYRRRGTLEEHAPITAGGGEIWIAIGGMAVPFVVLTVLFVLGLKLLGEFPIHGRPGPITVSTEERMKPEIRIVGHQWWWQIEYLNSDPAKEFTTANELHLPVGRPVYIEVVTADVMHSFWIPALHGKVDLIPGLTNYILIQASQTGNYVGQCAEFCGVQHAHMRLLAVVQKPEEYSEWAQDQRQPAAEPKTPEEVAGKQVFFSGPCSACHQIRGTAAHGRAGPDLTHIGSRQDIGADSFPNNFAYLEAWVTNAQSLKPGVLMPNVTQFTGVQLQELTDYLRQLK